MRLPPDTVLLCGAEAPPELLAVWAEERLAVLPLPAPDQLEAALEALGTTTVVVVGDGAAAAAALGFRVFWIGDEPAPEGVRAVTLAQTLAAARLARARERWKAGRAAS